MAGRRLNGNGKVLFGYIIQGASSFEVSLFLGCYVGNNPISNLSSEYMCKLKPEHLETIHRVLKSMNLDSKVVLYVWRPVQFCNSSFSEAPRVGADILLREFLEPGAEWNNPAFHWAACGLWDPLDIHMLSYNPAKEALFAFFWNAVFAFSGIDSRTVVDEDNLQTSRFCS